MPVDLVIPIRGRVFLKSATFSIRLSQAISALVPEGSRNTDVVAS